MKRHGPHGKLSLCGEWVVGGKLTFLPARRSRAEGLFDLPPGDEAAFAYIAESEAATVAALRADFNAAALPCAGRDSWEPLR